MKLAAVLALAVLALSSVGCTTFCVVGVRESAAVVCAPDEPWGSCLPKVEKDLAAKQEAAIELLKHAATSKN